MSTIVRGTEKIVNPLQVSALNKKGLCDYVINIASGCLHGCTFCYVPSTPVIRMREKELKGQGIENPQMDWGKYLLIRENAPEQLEEILQRKRTWQETSSGKGVVLLCSGTDPYQNRATASITRRVVQILLKHDRRVRILTRSPLWLEDLDVLCHPNVTVGMSLPHLNDEVSRQIEPGAPLPSDRYRALLKGAESGCRIYIAMAPTCPGMGVTQIAKHLEKLLLLNPEVIFWEPINPRGSNGKRMLAVGLDFVGNIMDRTSWANYFAQQWDDIEQAASAVSCLHLLHIWPDRELEGLIDSERLKFWWYRPTVEFW